MDLDGRTKSTRRRRQNRGSISPPACSNTDIAARALQHIIVIGAGLAGLTVAIALAKGGHQVEILESAPVITYIGAGIQVSSNSSRILRRLGIDKYLEKYCTEPVDLRMMRWEDGQLLAAQSTSTPASSPSINPDAGSLLTKDAVTYSGDLIVASDGLNSMARAVVLGRSAPPIPTGQMAYRVTLPAAKLRGIPELEEMITVPRNNHFLGPHGTILSYLLQGQNEPLINFVLTCDVNETDLPPGVDQRMGTAKEVRNSFKGWDPRIETMLERGHEHRRRRDPRRHPLASALLRPSALAAALPLYERLRLGRTAKVAAASVESRWFTQMEDGEKQRERDAWLLLHPGIEEGHINLRSDKLWLDELFGYDAYQVLEEALREVPTEA
ncbi:hypothetical protein B0H17DRAFT_1144218 [Mycena rosella]|uniref:FAD-dependent oxidoreductase 2 FAD-binding domain-containing protein n=1 Tax=Mycena rosella TaxID=1033263 RepID=A0AAD7CX86_MYCRO|nr:hypothetical protein B0H17DRAFT_1144218 [Mycena rosella]